MEEEDIIEIANGGGWREGVGWRRKLEERWRMKEGGERVVSGGRVNGVEHAESEFAHYMPKLPPPRSSGTFGAVARAAGFSAEGEHFS